MSYAQTSLSKLYAYIWLSLAAFIICVVAFAFHVSAERALRQAEAMRLRSLLLAGELRQSSSDLSRMARSYAATGLEEYREYYQEVLDIRDGRKPRPLEYESTYWHLVDDDSRPVPMGEPSALLQRIEMAGFTQDEFNKLAEAKARSDSLVGIERAAMRLVEAGDGESSENIPPADRLAAVRMLYDAEYRRSKADIMQPIHDLTRMVDTRTASQVAVAERHALLTLNTFIAFGVVMTVLLFQLRRSLLDVLGASVTELHQTVSTVAAGDLAAIAGHDQNKDSIMDKLVELQSHRIDAARQHRESERALTEAEQRFRDVVTAANDGICVIQDALICFANPRMYQLTGYGEDDLIGRSFMELVHEEDRNQLLDNYRKRIDEFEAGVHIVFRMRGRDRRQLIVDGHAAQFEWGGRPATLYLVEEVAGDDPAQK
jgi:PAS domain S-box-containing protein